ncbi:hypothetical protein PHIM7_182 [Sinorhizobium phage phiM7]|uniref:Transmembrane protein n=2 Tax=Emdodecavirus TaxID=1980937 RepID=S5MPX5_9CAUD|nr:hypothetical protein AB690_gp318 [Sinorhizobium phage phiM12]YP_009601307.1 hypothetical protein FDH46_gp296 [Sinorhizobium phage phiM7]AGR47885.1 hypothetical protein SmphiM12_253 [Sinorhizobium phage phiM12]AKF12727.1 hypothetical protein PHIM7_182 [Sinorhizobium phage phiM7]AKF13087.1 hypothetical protein PHIM19_182 [Sinorhizobium phage phiM19]
MSDTTYLPVELHPSDVRKDELEPFINDDGKAFNGNYRAVMIAVAIVFLLIAAVFVNLVASPLINLLLSFI